MGQNLGPLNIKDSYQSLLQISGSDQITDGTGSAVSSLDISASFATTASHALNGGVTSIIAGSNITIDQGTGDVTISSTGGGTVDTGSLLVTASISDAQITFTKGDASTFDITVDNVTTATTASYVAAANVDGTVANATSASHADNASTADSATTATTASYVAAANVDGTVANATSASYAVTASYAENAAGGAGFPFSGSAAILGTLDVNVSGATDAYTLTSGSFSGSVIDNITDTYTANAAVKHVVSLTQAEYDALTPDTDTLYYITDATSPVVTGSVSQGDLTLERSDASTFTLEVAGLANGSAPESIISRGITTTDAKAEGTGSIAIGNNAVVTGSDSENSIVIGTDADSRDNSDRNIIIGYNATMTDNNRADSVVIGANATAYQESVVIGANTNGLYGSVAVGRYAYNNDNFGVALGYGARTNNNGGIAIGSGSLQDGNYSIAIGHGAHATAEGDVVINNGDKNVIDYDESDDEMILSGSLRNLGGIAFGFETYPTTITTNGNVVIGGSGNGNSNNGPRITAGTAGVVIGGYNTTISATNKNWNSILGGSGNRITGGGTSTIAGGYYNNITGGEWGSIFGAKNSTISATGAQPRVLVGGDGNSLSGGRDNAMIAGDSNTLTHDRSVVIGGQSLSSTKADEVSVPNLTVNGDTEIISGSISGSLIDNLVPTASITQTQVQHIVSLDEDTYDALTTSADTLYLVGDASGSVVDGYLRGTVEALTITSATASMDCKLGNFFTLTVSGSVHLEASNIQAGQTINLRLTQPATPGTLTFSSDFEFAGGAAPAVTNIGSSTDIMSFVTFDGTTLYGDMINNFS